MHAGVTAGLGVPLPRAGFSAVAHCRAFLAVFTAVKLAKHADLITGLESEVDLENP
jgi:hypothetical protein